MKLYLLSVGQELLFPMPAGAIEFRSIIQTCTLRLKNYVVFFFDAQSTFFGVRVEFFRSVNYAPVDFVVFIFILKFLKVYIVYTKLSCLSINIEYIIIVIPLFVGEFWRIHKKYSKMKISNTR